MRKLFSKNGFVISAIVAITLTIALGCYFAFGGKLEEVYIPEDANLLNTTLTRPTSGNPSEYSAKDNLYIAQGVATSSSFSTVVTGNTKASIVSQEIYAERVVTPKSCYKKSISASTFVKVGTECYITNGNYLVRQAKKVDAIDRYQFVNEDSYLTKLSAEDYYNFYGDTPNKLSNYIINDSTILSAEFVGLTQDGLYEFNYTLDPTLSTIGIRNEMRTMAGTEKHPVITSVNFKLWLLPNWDIARTETHAEYKVEMKGLGVISCEEHTTEHFTFSNNVTIKDESYFQSKVDSNDISTELVLTPSTTDILLNTFGDMLEGEPMLLDFKVNNDNNLTGQIELSLDIENINNTTAIIYLNKLDTTIKYANNQIFVSSNDINGYIDINDYAPLFEDLMFELGFDTSEFENIDANSLLKDLTLTDIGDTLTLDINTNILGIDISANVNINKSTKEINATATLFDGLSLSLSSAKEEKIKNLDDITFYNFAPLIDTLLNQKIYLSNYSDDFSVKMLADFSTLEIIGNASIFNKNIKFKINPAKFQAEIDGVLTQSTKLEEVIGLATTLLFSPQATNEKTINFSDIIQSIGLNSDENDNLYLSVNIAGIDIKLEILATTEGYNLSQILIDTESLDTNLKIENHLEIEKINASLSPISIDNIFSLLGNSSLSYELNLANLNILTNIDFASKQIYAYLPDFELNLWLLTDGIYIQREDIKGFIKYNDYEYIITLLAPILGEEIIDKLNFQSINIDPIEIIKSINLSDANNKFSIYFKCLDNELALSCPITNDAIDIDNLNVNFGNLSANINRTAFPYKEMNKTEFYNLTPILETIDNGLITFETTISSHTIKATIDLKTNKIHALLDNQLKMLIENNILYANFNDLYFKFELKNLSNLLPRLKADFGLEIPELTGFDLDEILNSINNMTTTVSDNTTSIDINIFNIPLSVVLNSENNNYKLDSVNIQIENMKIALIPTTSHFISNFNTSSQSFIDANDVIENYYDTIISIIKSDFITINASGTIVDKPFENCYTSIPYSLDITLPISSNEMKIVATLTFAIEEFIDGEKTKSSEHTIWLNYQSNRLYFEYNGIKGTFNTDELDRSVSSITKLLDNIPQLKTLLENLISLSTINFDITTYDLCSIIKNIKYNSNKDLALVLNLSFLNDTLPENLELNISKKNNSSLNIATIKNTSFSGVDIGIDANIAPLDKEQEESTFNVQNIDEFIVFDSVNNLLETLANTVSIRHFHVTANVNINLIVSIDIALDLKVDIDEFGVATIVAVLDNSNSSALGSSIAFKNKSFKTTIFTNTESNTIYCSKYYTYTETVWEGKFIKLPVTYTREVTDYKTFTTEDFSNNFMDILIYLLDLGDTISNALKNPSEDNSGESATVEKVFQDYSYDSNKCNYSLVLNLSSLSSMLGETTINITHTSPENGEIQLNKLNVKLRLLNLLDLKLDATLVDHNNNDYGTANQMTEFIITHSFVSMY